MSDSRTQTGTTDDRKMSLQTTLAAGLGAGTLGIIAGYLADCAHADHLLPPPQDVVVILLGASLPAVHLLGRIVLYWLGRLLPKDANP